jgi:hypothetical protein
VPRMLPTRLPKRPTLPLRAPASLTASRHDATKTDESIPRALHVIVLSQHTHTPPRPPLEPQFFHPHAPPRFGPKKGRLVPVSNSHLANRNSGTPLATPPFDNADCLSHPVRRGPPRCTGRRATSSPLRPSCSHTWAPTSRPRTRYAPNRRCGILSNFFFEICFPPLFLYSQPMRR